MSSPVLWYATRATGLVALILLTATTVLGIVTANRTAGRRWPGFALQDLHRRISVITMGFLALHIVTSVVDTYVHIGWAAVAVTSFLRSRIRARTWRAVHWLAYLSWPVALSHAFGMGTDMRQRWVMGLAIGCMAAVIGAGAWRMVLAATRKHRALALVPVHHRPQGVPVKHIST
jgi:predicted ferric reductase